MSTIDYDFDFDLFGCGEAAIRITARLMSASSPPSYDPIYGGDPGWGPDWDIDSLQVQNSAGEYEKVSTSILVQIQHTVKCNAWQDILVHITESIEEDVRAGNTDERADMIRGDF